MKQMGASQSLEVHTIHDTLSTCEAAEILHVSRPYIVKLLDPGLIPCIAGGETIRKNLVQIATELYQPLTGVLSIGVKFAPGKIKVQSRKTLTWK